MLAEHLDGPGSLVHLVLDVALLAHLVRLGKLLWKVCNAEEPLRLRRVGSVVISPLSSSDS